MPGSDVLQGGCGMWEYLTNKIDPRRKGKESSDIHPARKPSPPGAEGKVRIQSDEPPLNRVQNSSRGEARSKRRKRTLKCPVCNVSMQKRYVGQVEIDECPDCLGIFLDRGELRAMGYEEKSSYIKTRNSRKEALIYTPEGLSDHLREN